MAYDSSLRHQSRIHCELQACASLSHSLFFRPSGLKQEEDKRNSTLMP